jgi:hypothetical protein
MVNIAKVVRRCFRTFQKRPEAKKSDFRTARDKGCQYLLTKQHSDGSFGNPQRGVKAYFKVLMAFHACGYNREAHQLCQWIRSCGMTPDGDFSPRPQGQREYDYIYPNSWIVIGAHQLGAFDISQRGMDFLMGFRDSQSGGFYSSPTEREASTKQDLIYVGFAGLAALYMGRIEIARGVGSWMNNLLTAQPEFPQALYTVYSREQGLCTQYDPKEASRHFLSCTASTGDQFFFQVGVAGGFLAELYLATGEKEWLELAKQFMQCALVANDHLFSTVRAGKVGWAASILHSLTGERQYKDMAIRVGNFLVSCQAKQGYWASGPGKAGSNDITAEMVLWLDAIDHVVNQP